MPDLSQVSDVAKQVLIDWLEIGQSLGALSDSKLIELAESFTGEIPIDSPVYGLVTELIERLKRPGTLARFNRELQMLEREIYDVRAAFEALPIEVQDIIQEKAEK